MSLKRIIAYILDPTPHTAPMYLVMGLTALWCARRARRELAPKPPREEPHQACPYTVPSLDSPARN